MTPPLPSTVSPLKPNNVELLTSETRAQQFLEAVPVGIMVFDANGKVFYTNKTAQQTLNHNFSLQERDGSAVHLSPSIEDYSLYLAGTQQPYPTETHPCKRVLQGETVTADDIELHLGDHIMPLEVWATPIFDEHQQVIYAILAFQDISERKQAQQMQKRYMAELAELTLRLKDSLLAVQHSEQKLAQFLDALPVGVAVLEADGRSAYINRRAQQLLGKDIVIEVITDSDAEVYPVYLAGSDQPYPSMNQPAILALQGQSATVDDIEIHQSDKIIPIEVWATPIFNDKQAVNYAVVAFQDITERKRAQATQDQYTQDLANLNIQLEEYTRSLEQKVEERTAALMAQTEEANRANQSKTRFLAAASHDLRQPLYALRLFIDVLESRLAEDNVVRPLVQTIQQTVAVMANLFEALLDISRLDAGAVQSVLKSFDLWILFKTSIG